MNTDRDNFHDWARAKEDTAFGALPQDPVRTPPDSPVVRWGRMLVFALLAAALVVGFKLLAGL